MNEVAGDAADGSSEGKSIEQNGKGEGDDDSHTMYSTKKQIRPDIGLTSFISGTVYYRNSLQLLQK